MTGIIIKGITYRLDRLDMSGQTCYAQFDLYINDVRTGSMALERTQGSQSMCRVEAYKALVAQLGSDITVPTDIDAELFPEEQPSERVLQLRDMYRQSTQALCQLAGVTPVTKLSDVEFIPVRTAAKAHDLATATDLCENISYCLFQLYRTDGDSAWDKI